MKREKSTAQGKRAAKIFSGRGISLASQQLYSESTDLFCTIIKEEFPPGKYTLVDMGSFNGAFLKSILSNLGDFSFVTIGIDRNEIIKHNKITDQIIACDLDKVPLDKNSSDITIVRYVLNWNSWEDQKRIINEISRITKGVCIIQHIGPIDESTDLWREKFDILFSGQHIKKLERKSYYFSSKDEIENYFKESHVQFKRIQDRKISCAFDALAERFHLST